MNDRFAEKILPVESVVEYFQHFPVLEIDFTFYRSLIDKSGKPTFNHHVLQKYHSYMGKNDRVFLKNNLHGFIFEQEYQRKEAGLTPEGFTAELDDYFSNIPSDNRYHVEIRTARFLSEPLYRILRKHRIGMVLSHC